MSIDNKLTHLLSKVEEAVDAIHKIDKDQALQKAAFDDHSKQDEKMWDELKRMNDILADNVESLREHMAQTRLLKDTVLKIDERLAPIERERIEKEAIEKYRNEKLKKYGKYLGAIATGIGILAALKPIMLRMLGL